MSKKTTQFHTVESLSAEQKAQNQRIADIKNKITWGTANFHERNILKIWEKNQAKLKANAKSKKHNSK